MLMYDPMAPMLMLVPLVEVLKGTKGEGCGRFGGRGDVKGEIFEIIADLGLSCFNCCGGGSGGLRAMDRERVLHSKVTPRLKRGFSSPRGRWRYGGS